MPPIQIPDMFWENSVNPVILTRDTLTPEQYTQLREQILRQQEEEMARREAAQAKAMVLLRSCLTKDQITEMEKHSFFTVKGNKGGTYRIYTTGTTGNVHQIAGSCWNPARRFPVAFPANYKSWCIYLRDVPAADTWLAQKLLLQTDEAAFQQIAY